MYSFYVAGMKILNMILHRSSPSKHSLLILILLELVIAELHAREALSHFLATLGAQEEADCTSMLSSIDSCQNRVSADQYHLTVSRAQVSTHQGRVFFWSYPLTIYSFSNDCRLTFTVFKIHIKYVVFMSVSPRTITILISNWPQTQKFSSFFKIQAGKTFSYHGHVLVMLHVQFLCSDWLKFDRWVHA